MFKQAEYIVHKEQMPRKKHSGHTVMFAGVIILSLLMGKGISAYASDTANSAPVKTASFPTQVYNFEKLLEAENDVLSFREAAREAKPSYDPDFVPEGADGPQGPTPEQFLADIRDSYEARLSVLHRFSDFTQMSESTYMAFCALLVEAERPFYDIYRTAEFANLNYQVLCRGYTNGLNRQYQALEMAKDSKTDSSVVQAAYFEGYTMRSNILLELNQYYYSEENPLPELESLSGTRDMGAIVENARAADEEAGEDLTRRVQKGLNAAGFDCGEADGIVGSNTILSICHYQRSRQMEENGLITEDLASNLPVSEENSD